MYMDVCLHVYLLHVFIVPREATKGHWTPKNGVKDGCKPPCRCWELNPGDLEDQTTELSL